MSGVLAASLPCIVFAGTPDFASRILSALLDCGDYCVSAVYAQPDRPAGRGKQLRVSPVKQLAVRRRLSVYQPGSLRNPNAQQELRLLTPDVLVVAAYGLILPPEVLAIPRHGCINVHASLLPRWRGAAPIERAIEAGDSHTGITIMQMDEGLDTGDVLLRRECEIGTTETAESLRDRLSVLGAQTLLQSLPLLFANSLQREKQDSARASYAPKLRREEALIDWRLDAQLLARRVRAFNASNVCQSALGGYSVRVWSACAEDAPSLAAPGTILATARDGIRVACGGGVLRLTQLQLPGGRPLDAAALLNGRAELFCPGKQFGSA